MAGLKQAGITSNEPPTTLPAGVIALVGWANRLLVLAYCAWTIVIAQKASEINRR
jgi:hypothetical protein